MSVDKKMSFLSLTSSAAMTVAGGTEEQCTMAACLEERQRGDISLRGAVHGSGWPGMEDEAWWQPAHRSNGVR
jgi:hypothetical protein